MAGADGDRSQQVASFWASEFGDSYTERNRLTDDLVRVRIRGLAQILSRLDGDPPRSLLECGCNAGPNLAALRHLTSAELFAIEPNGEARRRVLDSGLLPDSHLKDATLDRLPFESSSMDLVFTSGVLIHVPPDRLPQAFDEIHRVSAKYILMIEYFAKNPEELAYRGHQGLLFKRDFGGSLLDRYPTLKTIDVGFLWSRTTGFDDATWWLFRKPDA